MHHFFFIFEHRSETYNSITHTRMIIFQVIFAPFFNYCTGNSLKYIYMYLLYNTHSGDFFPYSNTHSRDFFPSPYRPFFNYCTGNFRKYINLGTAVNLRGHRWYDNAMRLRPPDFFRNSAHGGNRAQSSGVQTLLWDLQYHKDLKWPTRVHMLVVRTLMPYQQIISVIPYCKDHCHLRYQMRGTNS